MSAPLVVNTNDGTVWTRREGSRGGEALYAPEKCGQCPEFVMATLTELAGHGIAGSADVLPVPVGPQPWSQAEARDEFERILREKFRLADALAKALRDAAGARRERDRMRERVSEPYGCTHCGTAKRSHGRQYLSGVGMHAWERPTDDQVKDRMLARRAARMPLDVEELRARVAELKAERADEHDELALALGRSNGAEWGDLIEYAAGAVSVEAKWERHRAELTALRNDALNMRGALSPNGEDRKVPMPLGETLTPAVEWLLARVAELEAERHTTNEALSEAAEALRADRDRIAELEAAPVTVYRAEHPDSGITLGHYSAIAAAHQHCEALARREGNTGVVSWVPDDSDPWSPEELTFFDVEYCDGDDVPVQTCTGYVVTPLEVPSEYDEEADE